MPPGVVGVTAFLGFTNTVTYLFVRVVYLRFWWTKAMFLSAQSLALVGSFCVNWIDSPLGASVWRKSPLKVCRAARNFLWTQSHWMKRWSCIRCVDRKDWGPGRLRAAAIGTTFGRSCKKDSTPCWHFWQRWETHVLTSKSLSSNLACEKENRVNGKHMNAKTTSL